jgi:elongation factor 2
MADVSVSPEKGTVCFGSALLGFGFTLTRLAQFYGPLFNLPFKKVLPLLWGEHFYDSKARSFVSKQINKEGEVLPRAFCHLILRPIIDVATALSEHNDELLSRTLP